MYADGHLAPDVRRLPLNLLDAIRAFSASDVLRERLGAGFTEAYAKLKLAEWHDYTRHLTQWERDHTLDC
jgi:glutamine synthetase